jgi:beta-phosphoglucomutase-like phosphatase (HAD superfamily)
MLDGLFWDNDGVLMETEHLYYQANAEALARAGVELSLEDFCRISLRQGESVLSLATVAGQSDSEAAELRRVRDEIYEDYSASKPDPEPYRTACARAGLNPGRCLAIEDSERGVTSAARAGLVVAAIPGHMNRGGHFGAARWLLDGVHELPALLSLD